MTRNIIMFHYPYIAPTDASKRVLGCRISVLGSGFLRFRGVSTRKFYCGAWLQACVEQARP